MAQHRIRGGPTSLFSAAHLCRSDRDSTQVSRQPVQQRPPIQRQVTADMLSIAVVSRMRLTCFEGPAENWDEPSS